VDQAARGVTFAGFLGRRLAALALTVVLAPTIVWTVFNGLRGTGGQPLYEVAADYVVTTYWHLDLGTSSAYYGGSVWEVVEYTWPADLAMVVGGIASGVVLGTAAGLACAAWPGSVVSRALQFGGAVVLSTPPYWLGFMVLVFFAPGTGYVLELPFLSALMDYQELTLDPLGWLKALWVPWILVGLPLAAGVMRMTVVTLRDAIGEDFIRTARAKGLSPGRVLRRHALPVAVAPVAALVGASMPLLVTNIALMESAFNIPGLYREIRSVYSNADLPLIQAMVIETTILIVVANTLADIIQARLDPRVR
jgi:peptide/nickel transport system permease protein